MANCGFKRLVWAFGRKGGLGQVHELVLPACGECLERGQLVGKKCAHSVRYGAYCSATASKQYPVCSILHKLCTPFTRDAALLSIVASQAFCQGSLGASIAVIESVVFSSPSDRAAFRPAKSGLPASTCCASNAWLSPQWLHDKAEHPCSDAKISLQGVPWLALAFRAPGKSRNAV